MKKTLLLSVACVAISATSAIALDEEFTPINPLYGNIDPFYGDLNPFYGDLNPFYGDISPFWGDISPFWGDINPFYGDIGAFWGDLDPFYGNIDPFYGDLNAFYGDIGAFYGDIGAFWGDLGPFWGDLDAFWGDLDPFTNDTEEDYETVADTLNTIFSDAEALFGGAVEAKTGLDFENGFLAGFLRDHGIDLDDLSTLANLTGADRARFFMDFYDGLMSFSGRDHIDHWMPITNWSPVISQNAGFGAGAHVGVLDTGVFDISFLSSKPRHMNGGEYAEQNHGAAVASLIAAMHDGEGVMGVAPKATVSVYNPFDETFTTNFEDVTDGVLRLSQNGAHVINLSLGMSGHVLHENWADVFSHEKLAPFNDQLVFVKAAGNDGITQLNDVELGAAADIIDQLLIVGSVNPNGEISSFSNRPGSACITVDLKCAEGSRLMDRFLVAPGELLLVADNEGGVIRQSGTSFAAPLVSGAVALLHSRWSWLAQNPEESADIILQSAQDLGDPGVDAVYGHGLLDIEASQNPLNPNNLVIATSIGNGTKVKDSGFVYQGTVPFATDASVSAVEYIGDTHRDFEILLSSLDQEVSDPSVAQANASQDYLDEQVLTSTATLEPTGGKGKGSKFTFTDSASTDRTIMRTRDTSLSVTVKRKLRLGDDYSPVDRDVEFAYRNDAKGVSLNFGRGDGAVTVGGQANFGMSSDYDTSTGGVNPALGLASGGFFGNAAFDLNRNLALRVGFTQRTDTHQYIDGYSGEILDRYAGISDYEAAAVNLGMSYYLSQQTQIGVDYTRLQEQTGLLGIQGSGALGLDGGAWTDAMTLSASQDFSRGITLAGSLTVSRTDASGFDNSVLGVTSGGVVNTAWELAATKQGIFEKEDILRIAVSQPLYAESGALTVTAQQVIDRETGELGLITDSVAFSPQRRYVLEMLYGRPVLRKRGYLSAFGRFSNQEFVGTETEGDLAVGATFTFNY